MSLASEGSAWYRCVDCQAVFKLKHLMVRHLKTRHNLPDRPEWELDNNDEKCASWWERVKVEGSTVLRVEPVIKLSQTVKMEYSTMTPTFSLMELNASSTRSCTSNPATLLLSEEAKKFKCGLCNVDMWFAFKKSLYAHLLKNHDMGLCKIPGINRCRFCGFNAESPSHLKGHVRTHTGESEEDARLVECAGRCGRVFSSKASMKKHVRFKCAEAKRLGLDDVVREGSIQPGVVVMGGRGVGNLDVGAVGPGEELMRAPRVPKTNPHVLRQSATDLPYKCSQCVETFPSAARLSGHMGVHSGDLYRCRYCSAPFAHVHTRGAHETNAHNDELGYGYRCPVCSKNFANIATIRGHYKYTHWLDLPPREEIESWRIGASTMQLEQETVIVQPDQVQQQEQQQPDFHSMMQHHHQSQPLQHQHQEHVHQHHQPHHVQVQTQQRQQPPSHSSSNMNMGLRMPVGFGVSQVTMGALIGHMPVGVGEYRIGVLPRNDPNSTHGGTVHLGQPEPPGPGPKKIRKPRVPRNNKTGPVSGLSKGGPQGRGKKKKTAPKIERKKFHCRKPGCEGKFQRRWELTWHLERAHGEFTCEFCSNPPFHTKMEMVHHQYQIHHRELGCYECRLCSRGLESPRGVQEHVAMEHPGTEVPLTLEAKMWRRGAIHRKRVQRPVPQ